MSSSKMVIPPHCKEEKRNIEVLYLRSFVAEASLWHGSLEYVAIFWLCIAAFLVPKICTNE